MRVGKLIRGVLMGVVPIAGLVVASYYYTKDQRYVSTENAYVRAEVVTVSAQIDGRIEFVNAGENAKVSEGQVLVGIDSRPLETALAAAEADLAAAKLEIAAMQARYRQGRAEIESATERVRYLETEFARQKSLADKGIGAKAKSEAAEHDLNLARRQLATLRETNRIVLAELGGALDTPVDQHPLVRRAEADVDAANVALSNSIFFAPMSGYVGNVEIQIGEYVEAGDPLFALVGGEELWVQANLKEVQLTHVREGQSATVVVDGFPDLTWRAKVESISPATGSEFALLPAQNASGNWVKVVQRVPVRLQLERTGRENLLRAGMTAEVRIDTERDRDLFELAKGVLAGSLPK